MPSTTRDSGGNLDWVNFWKCQQKTLDKIFIDVEPMNGVNFRLELSKMAGGPLLWQMIGNMQAKVSCATSNSKKYFSSTIFF
jgi:hypothetical protein